jgi:hypothetical protein
LLIELPTDDGFVTTYQLSYPFTWIVGEDNRVLTLGPLLVGLIELAVVLGIALLIHRRYHRSASDIANPSY